MAGEIVRGYGWRLRAELASRPVLRRRRRAPADRTALLLAWSFPPIVDGGTYRPLALARYGPALGWKMLVIGAQPWRQPDPAGTHLCQVVPPSVQVARVRHLPPRSAGTFLQLDNTTLNGLAMVNAARRAFRSSRPTVIIASGPPFHTFLAGYYLAKLFDCRLLLDYRDEWTECPFDFVTNGRDDRRLEERCLIAADAVVFTTRSQLDHQLQVFSALSPAKCRIIPNGWEPADEPITDGTAGDGLPPASGAVLSFIGTLGSWTRPGSFLKTLERVLQRRPELMRALRLRFVGARTEEVARELRSFPYPEMLEIVDQVPSPTAARMMRASTALLLLNEPRLARYLPGKVYEYVASRRPILVFGDGGETAALVRQLGAGVVVGDADADCLEGALDRIIGGNLDRSSASSIDDWIGSHTREGMATQFFDALEVMRS